MSCANEYGLFPSEIELRQPALIHAKLGALLAERRFGVKDPSVLQSIRTHTTGAAQMTALDKIIYLSDSIEPGRNFVGVQLIRELAEKDLDAAVLAAFDQGIRFVLDGGGLLHPDTVDGRNSLLMEMKAKRNEK